MASLVYCVTSGTADESLEIAAGLRRRDPDLLEWLIGQHQHRLLRYLVSLTGDRALAADLFQETWLRVLERGHRYDGRYSFVPWLLTVARNLAIDALRARRSISLDALTSGGEDEAPLQLEDRGPDPYEVLASREQGERLEVFLSCLPPHYREALVLRFQEDLSLQEIAVITKAPLSTVKTRLARGLKAFGARLKEHR
jgi:RNA polymerase sigma-70 factor (ECF subfamily)